jgi:hypothetical protein
MVRLILIASLTAGLELTPTQDDASGFYFVVDCQKNSKKFFAPERETVCLTSRPIIEFSKIENVSEIYHSKGISFFDIKLSKKSYELLKNLVPETSNKKLALMLNGEILGVISYDDQSIYQVIRIIRKQDELIGIRLKILQVLDNKP